MLDVDITETLAMHGSGHTTGGVNSALIACFHIYIYSSLHYANHIIVVSDVENLRASKATLMICALCF